MTLFCCSREPAGLQCFKHHNLCMQFTELGRHKHIEGMEHITAGFETILEEIRRKPYDLLDATRCGPGVSLSSGCQWLMYATPPLHFLRCRDTAQCRCRDQFDRDYLEFEVNINDLEATLQVVAAAPLCC